MMQHVCAAGRPGAIKSAECWQPAPTWQLPTPRTRGMLLLLLLLLLWLLLWLWLLLLLAE